MVTLLSFHVDFFTSSFPAYRCEHVKLAFVLFCFRVLFFGFCSWFLAPAHLWLQLMAVELSSEARA